MTVKREKLTVDVYYASETAEGKNVAKSPLLRTTPKLVPKSVPVRSCVKVMPPAAVRDSIPVYFRCN